MFRLHTFGSCFVTLDGAPFDLLSGQRKGLALLAMIAASGERGVSRESVLAYLWPESDETRARTSLKQLVHSLRRQSGEPTLLLSTATLRLDPQVITSDVADFREAIRAEDFETAAGLYTGAFLEGFYLRGVDGFERWAAAERAPLARDFARALESLAVRASTSGEPTVAVDWWRRLADAEPLSARAATGLMLALDAAGDRAAALQYAGRYEQFVHEELGVAPDPSVAALTSRLQSTATSPNASRAAAPPSPRPAVPRASVAVLPFANTSGEPADQPFVDGLTDELIGALGKVIGLKVAGRTSAFAVGGRGLSAREVGAAVGVATVLEGSVRRSGSRLKVSAQLVSAEDDAVLWTDTYLREVSDVFLLQEEIAQAIVTALRLKLRRPGETSSHARLVGRPPASLEAYELYLKGRHVWNTQFSGDGLALALSYFEQAVARDPTYARAYAGISDAHAVLAIFGFGRASDAFAAAKTAAQKALAFDDSLAEAHVSLGHVLFVHDFAWDAAERSFRRGIELDPASSTAYSFFAVCLQDQGRFDEAMSQLLTARSIDPLSPHVGNLLGRVYVNARQADDAIRVLLESLELFPHSDLAYQQLGHAYLQKELPDEALAAFRQAAGLSGSRDTAHLAYGMAVTGDQSGARQLLHELMGGLADPDRLSFHIAMAHSGLGDVDDAFRWLDRGFANRAAFMDGVKITPAFDMLHGDPRWISLLRRMGLHG